MGAFLNRLPLFPEISDNTPTMNMKKNKNAWVIAGAVVTIVIIWAIVHVSGSSRKLLGSATYFCDGAKAIEASFYEGKTMETPAPGEMPQPTGTVDVSLDGSPIMSLHQTISADGVRYANGDESLVFWSKGTSVLVMRNNVMDPMYTNCDATRSATASSTTPVTPAPTKPSTSTPAAPVACTMEAKMCPDGSYVGRSGPKCEFAACPTIVGQTDLGTISVGETKVVNGVSISLNKIVEDSRCPANVQCIQAGRALASVTLVAGSNVETRNLSSQPITPYIFGMYKISLIEVLPERFETTLPAQGSYRLTFRVEK